MNFVLKGCAFINMNVLWISKRKKQNLFLHRWKEDGAAAFQGMDKSRITFPISFFELTCTVGRRR